MKFNNIYIFEVPYNLLNKLLSDFPHLVAHLGNRSSVRRFLGRVLDELRQNPWHGASQAAQVGLSTASPAGLLRSTQSFSPTARPQSHDETKQRFSTQVPKWQRNQGLQELEGTGQIWSHFSLTKCTGQMQPPGCM